MKKILIILLIIGVGSSLYAQKEAPKTTPKTTIELKEPETPKAEEKEEIPAPHIRQMYLEEPAMSLDSLQYKDGTPLNGHLSKDGMTLYIENYTKRGGVTVKLKLKNGEEKSVKRSPCYIDVTEEL